MATKKKTTSPVTPTEAKEEKVQLDFSDVAALSSNVPDSAMINVRSNVFGELFFTDPVTKEEFSWPDCGAVQQMPLATLRHMKNGAIKFFTNQLVVITGFADDNEQKYDVEDIYNTLYITQYYKDYLDPTDIGLLRTWTPEEIKEKVSLMSKSAKMELVVALNTHIENGSLDSLKSIRAFEEALGRELGRPE